MFFSDFDSTVPLEVLSNIVCRYVNQDELVAMQQPTPKPLSYWDIDHPQSLLKYRNTWAEKDQPPIDFPNSHFGQLKLLLSEVEFLAYIQRRFGYQILKKSIVLYVGAADGQHIVELCKCFPEMRIACWDPREYHPTFQRYAAANPRRVQLFRGLFSDKIAESYVGKGIIFICDIRNVPARDIATEHDSLRFNDHEMQLTWARIFKPELSMLKFQPRFGDTEIEYCDGVIRTQAFSPQTSNESRLIVDDPFSERTYDCLVYERLSNWANSILRSCIYTAHEALSADYSPIKANKTDLVTPWKLYIDGVMRYDDWRALCIVRGYLLTRMAYASTPESQERYGFDEYPPIKHVLIELNKQAFEVLSRWQEKLGTSQRKRLWARIIRREATT